MGVRVIVGTQKGGFICESDARRGEWRVKEPLFKGWKVTASARTNGGRFIVATASQVYGAALQVSDDDGATWRQVEHGPAYPDGHERDKMNQVWTLHVAGERLYAGVDTAGLFYSDDDGESWHPVPGLNDHATRDAWFPGAGGLCAHAVYVDPRNPQRVWCGISAVGVWRTDDGGETWQPKNEGIRNVIEDQEHKDIGYCVHALAFDPEDADVVYRQDHAGMYRSRDGGDSWEECMLGLASWFGFPITIDPRTRTLFAFPLESDEYRMPKNGRFRVYRSANGGDSWEELSAGLPGCPAYAGVLRGAMDVDGLDPCGVYIGSTAGEVFASADGGDHWQRLPVTLPRILSVRAYDVE